MNDLKTITVAGHKYILFSKHAARAVDLETFSQQPVMFVHIAEQLTGPDRSNYRHSWELIPLAPWLEAGPRVSPEEVQMFGDAIRPTLRKILEPSPEATAELEALGFE